jgi:hypothetical protein
MRHLNSTFENHSSRRGPDGVTSAVGGCLAARRGGDRTALREPIGRGSSDPSASEKDEGRVCDWFAGLRAVERGQVFAVLSASGKAKT